MQIRKRKQPFNLTAALLALAALLLAACGPADAGPLPAAPGAPTSTIPVAVVTLVAVPTSMQAATQTEPPANEPAATQDLSTQTPTTTAPAATLAVLPAPEGWLSLEDPARRYSFAYPPDWTVCQKTKYSLLFCGTMEDPLWNRAPLRLYVSALPLEYNNEDFEAYNFIPVDIVRRFAALPVGESMSKVPGSKLPGYTTYTRLPDQTVAGRSAAVVESPRVWEAPAETRDRAAFLFTGSAVYMVGMYYETPEQLALYEKLLETFSIAE